MTEEIKSVNITGGAACDYSGESKKRKRSTKKNQQGGNTLQNSVTPNGLAIQGNPVTTSYATSAGSPKPETWLKYPEQSPVPPTINKTQINNSVLSQLPQQIGGTTKNIRVELKKKTSVKKVHLQPKKQEAPKTSGSKKSQTKKVRKVTLGVSTLHKRMTRAKKLQKKMKEMPIDKLKEELIRKKLIKANSKAPESVLRQIAGDAEVVANKVL